MVKQDPSKHNPARTVPITDPLVHVGLTVATVLLRDRSQSSRLHRHHHCQHHEPHKGRELNLLCLALSCQRAWGTDSIKGLGSSPLPVSTPMPFAMWFVFLSLMRQILPSLPLYTGLSSWRPAEEKRKWWRTALSLDLRRLYMSPCSLLVSVITRRKTQPRRACWSYNQDEGHGGQVRLPWSFQLRPPKISQQSASWPTDT